MPEVLFKQNEDQQKNEISLLGFAQKNMFFIVKYTQWLQYSLPI